MLLLYIYKIFDSKPSEYFEDTIKIFRDTINVFVCGITAYNIYLYEKTDNPCYIHFVNTCVVYQCIIELAFINPSVFLHHYFILFFVYARYYIDTLNNTELNKNLLIMQFSAIPLILRNTIHHIRKRKDNSYFKCSELILNMFYTVSFFYYNIYLYNKNVLSVKTMYNKYEQYGKLITYTFTYMFYMLNIYWFLTILKNWVKQYRIFFHSPEKKRFEFSEWCLQYTCGIPFICSSFIYINDFKINYLCDLFGLFVLSISSYLYHRAIYRAFKQEKYSVNIDVLNDSIYKYYLFDISCILFNGFLKTYSYINIWNKDTVNIYIIPIEHIIVLPTKLVLSFFIGLYTTFYYKALCFLNKLKKDKVVFLYKETKLKNKFIWINIYVCTPLLFSIITKAMKSESYHNGLHILTSMYVTSLIRIMYIGYEYNHLFFHLCFLWLTIALCISDTSVFFHSSWKTIYPYHPFLQ